MSRTRIQQEQIFHDSQACERARFFTQYPERLRFSDEEYLSHESSITSALNELGEVRGKAVLDLGCGHGMASVVLARRGATVTALELSRKYIQEAKWRALANRVDIDFVQGDAQRLPFADASCDRIWGHAILHHLDVRQSALEIRRVLKPDGIAVFCEPWGENRLLRWARRHLPYRGKGHTPDEEPLRQRDVTVLRELFPQLKIQGVQLLSMAQRAIPLGPFRGIVRKCDEILLRCFPLLQRYCRYVVLRLNRSLTGSLS